MKSYSDDIPNVSTEEFKRSASVGDETNELVKTNLSEIKNVGDEVAANLSMSKNLGEELNALNSSFNQKLKWVLAVLVLVLLGQGALIALLVI